MSDTRVRFAPSPTGDPHIGSVWTAQFNWLFAKRQKGRFILRIEDTDQKRFVPGSTEKIYETLNWYELTPDEGPQQGGDFGPYIQSERLDIYRHHADQLLQQGSAYYCFCSAERLDHLRQLQQAAKLPTRYDKTCAQRNSADSLKRVAAGESAVVRLNVPATGTMVLHDLIRGDVTFRLDQLDDSVLLKSDGWPTYHLANVVDDHLMKISHVIRAEEWLPSAPKHLLLFQYFGWTPPQYAHLPLLLGADKTKLSKRHGATSALTFRDQGYLAPAMNNFLALMGWHPKEDSEILNREEMIAQFHLDEVNPSGAVFDQTKLDWMNGYYIRSLPLPELLQRLKPWWHLPTGEEHTEPWLLSALQLVRERMTTLADIDRLTQFFWSSGWNAAVKTFDRNIIVPKQGTMEVTKHHLAKAASWLENYTGPWEAAALKVGMLDGIAKAGKKNNDILWPLRVALSLSPASPDVFDLLAVLGKTESLRRVSTLLH